MSKHVLCRIILFFILFLLLFIFYSIKIYPGIILNLESDSPIDIKIFYDNKNASGYRFDDKNLTKTYNIDKGQANLQISVPRSGLNRLRIDFGSKPAKVVVHYILINKSPFSNYMLSGDNLIRYMSTTNDIKELKLQGNTVEYHISGNDGFIAAEQDLLDNSNLYKTYTFIKYLPIFIVISLLIAVLDIILKSFRILVKKLTGRNYLFKIIYKPTNIKQFTLLVISCLLLSLLIAYIIDGILLKLLYFIVNSLELETLSRYFAAGQTFSAIRMVFFFNIIFVVMLAVFIGIKKAIRYRYILALLLLILMTIGKFTGSSLGFYDGMLYGNTDNYTNSTLLGIPQGIRGDEWATEKPYYFAQVNGGEDLPYYNNKLMLQGADMVVHGFAPVKDIIILTRPSLIGFLFLPVDNAFAFYWWFKLIALFMAAFEISRIISKKILYGLFGAFIFIFAPPMRWWLSQAIIEMYFYAFFGITCLYYYFKYYNKRISILYLFGVFYFLMCYVMIMYPAVQVPFAYIMLPIIIWVIYNNLDKKPFTIKRIMLYLIVALPFISIIVRFFIMSGNAIDVVRNTIYPGIEREWINMDIAYPLYQLVSPYTALIKHPEFLNSCEISQYYIFSVVLVPYVVYLTVKYGKKMILPASICFVTCILQLFTIMPEMKFINKITLLSMSYPVRIYAVCGVGYVLVLISLFPIMKNNITGISKNMSRIFAIIFWFVLLGLASNNKNTFNYFLSFQLGTVIFLLTVTIFAYMVYLLLLGKANTNKKYMIILCILYFVSTATIDPITYGTDSMFEKTTMQAIRNINKENNGEGRWMVSGSPTIGNLVAAQGVSRVSGTYYYPDIPMMEIIDSEHEYEKYWNQFAHIDMRLSTKETDINILQHQVIKKVAGLDRIVYINIETAKKLGIKYVFTNVGVPEELIAKHQIEKIYQDETDNWDIYEIK